MRYFLTIIFCLTLFASCKKKHHETLAANEYYTCLMDPQVREKQPGNCPICQMKLTKVTVNASEEGKLKFSKTQMQLANIQLDTVRKLNIAEEIMLTARVEINQDESNVISSRVSGRVDKLYFRNTGDKIRKGDLLYEIYSESLSAAQQDYLLAEARAAKLNDSEINYSSLALAAKNKLLLWGMTEAQISALLQHGKVETLSPVYSKDDGIITDVKLREGDYVTEGGIVFEMNNFHSVWVQGQLYAGETNTVKQGDWVTVHLFDYPAQNFRAQVSYIQPELNGNSKILPFRIVLPNQNFMLKPGMAANVYIEHNAKAAIALPIDAVLQFSNSANVWIQNPDSSFENRMVKTGISNSRIIEIISGLTEGEIVVINGAYLINSDFQFKKGANPMEGMKM